MPVPGMFSCAQPADSMIEIIMTGSAEARPEIRLSAGIPAAVPRQGRQPLWPGAWRQVLRRGEDHHVLVPENLPVAGRVLAEIEQLIEVPGPVHDDEPHVLPGDDRRGPA